MPQEQNDQAEGTGSSLTRVAIHNDVPTSRSEIEMKNNKKGIADYTTTKTITTTTNNNDDDDDNNKTTAPTTTSMNRQVSSSSTQLQHSCRLSITQSKSDAEKVMELEAKAKEILSKENFEAKLARRKRRRQQMHTLDENCAGCSICCADCCGEMCTIM
mmetsp:Transcript_43025/g.48739  ORF Transcript_43025/g.48739 Transcript_43025/m.48739 type:complete len:159 (+) Transcript_43025:148-624(+)